MVQVYMDFRWNWICLPTCQYIPLFIKPQFRDLNSHNLTVNMSTRETVFISWIGSSSGFWLIEMMRSANMRALPPQQNNAPSSCEVIGFVLSAHAATSKIHALALPMSFHCVSHVWNILIPETWFYHHTLTLRLPVKLQVVPMNCLRNEANSDL